MLVMGVNGSGNLAHEEHFDVDAGDWHDAAAVLVEDGEVIAAFEQERIDRIKHSNKFPIEAMKACLDRRGVALGDLDALAYYSSKPRMDTYLKSHLVRMRVHKATEGLRGHTTVEDFFRDLLRENLGHDIRPEKLRFVVHHVAHLASAYGQSGFDRGLVVSVDGRGENEAGRVAVGAGHRLSTLRVIRAEQSLGHFYYFTIRYIGFSYFDEYKAMGLAPYGDPARFRALFKTFYDLLPNGSYATHTGRLTSLFTVLEPRRKSDPFSQIHMDVAASLQEALETIVFHVLSHWQRHTGQTNLCLAGGVAHNCTMNGKIAASGMFERVFVQPAAHDAGCALGAALSVWYEAGDQIDGEPRAASAPAKVPAWLASRGKAPAKVEHAPPAIEAPSAEPRSTPKTAPLDHLYWGTDIGTPESIGEALASWRDFLEIERVDDVERRAAALLAGGSVIGWAQGRAEFGPRALGNRSILADARPAENKEIINAMVKKREGFRPFAPSVLEEDADRYFDLAGLDRSPFMIFVVKVREEKRALLGAVTHVDGSARVQTVSRRTNERYWRLIREFESLTGVPVVLNTSFNNDAEPIVDTVEDAVVCFLTTKLHYLVVGDWIAKKREIGFAERVSLVPSTRPYLKLQQVKHFAGGAYVTEHAIGTTYDRRVSRPISADAFRVLSRADGRATIAELLDAETIAERDRAEAVVNEIVEIWGARMVVLRPRSGAASAHAA